MLSPTFSLHGPLSLRPVWRGVWVGVAVALLGLAVYALAPGHFALLALVAGLVLAVLHRVRQATGHSAPHAVVAPSHADGGSFPGYPSGHSVSAAGRGVVVDGGAFERAKSAERTGA